MWLLCTSLSQTLETAVDGDELVFLYQLKEGICQSSYAANIATLAGLPARLVQRGVEVNTHAHTHTEPQKHACIDWVCVCAWAGVWTLQDRNVYQTNWQSIISWAGKQVCWTPWTLYATMLTTNTTTICEAVCDQQVQVCGGQVPEPGPGGQRFGPSALHESWTPALCWWAVEPQLNWSVATTNTFLQLCGQFVSSLFIVFRALDRNTFI